MLHATETGLSSRRVGFLCLIRVQFYLISPNFKELMPGSVNAEGLKGWFSPGHKHKDKQILRRLVLVLMLMPQF